MNIIYSTITRVNYNKYVAHTDTNLPLTIKLCKDWITIIDLKGETIERLENEYDPIDDKYRMTASINCYANVVKLIH